jgi:hypothetical protein
MLVALAQLPLDSPGVPTAFECRADDVYVRLDDEGFLIIPHADAQHHDDGPRHSGGSERRSGSVGKKNEVVDERNIWFGETGEEATTAEEVADLREMEKVAADTPPYEISAFVTTPTGKVIHKQRLVAVLNQCPTMSNDRLPRIAEGIRYGDKSATITAEMADGQSGAIDLSTRVFARHVDKETDMARIWIDRV